MKKRIFSLMLSVLLLLPLFLFASCSPAAETASPETLPAVAASSNGAVGPIVSEPIDALALAGVKIGASSAHGNNQTRLVSVSSGTYLGVMTLRDSLTDKNEMSLIRVLPDGSCKVLYTDYIALGSATVTIMADAREDIWLYSGAPNSATPYSIFTVWHYDVSEDRTHCYSTSIMINNLESFGYSVALIDAAADKIYAIGVSADKPGIFLWCTFDLKTLEWGVPHVVETEYRYCYNYGYPDGKGGFFVVTERDITNQSTMTDLGILVSKAIRTYLSRKIDANYMWDELHIIHVPNPDSDEFEDIMVEAADYDVLNGLYPNITNGNGDTFLDKDGYLHVLYTADDDGVAGRFERQKIYDVSDGFKEVYDGELVLMFGQCESYTHRMFQDLEGNIYVIAASESALHVGVEIWMAVDKLGSDFHLVYTYDFQDPDIYQRGGSGANIIANNRSNSTPSDVAALIMCINVSNYESWYSYSVDFAALRAYIKSR